MEQTEKSSITKEWRIKQIPFRNPHAMIETNWGALVGAFLFIGGIGGIIAGYKIDALLPIAVSGITLALISLLFKNRILRRNWVKVYAQCIDKEYGSVIGRPGLHGGSGKTWTFQLLCTFELAGKNYTVTPGYWSTFFSENRVRKFLDKAISPDEMCHLWVNPKNPLQAELIAHDIKDILLH
ncbi:MAG: hypothetical protein GY702_13555 [Desulfobulbaceae bacterium]|nr:hypothetical protein [Desulfobulbaceae bacterium]